LPWIVDVHSDVEVLEAVAQIGDFLDCPVLATAVWCLGRRGSPRRGHPVVVGHSGDCCDRESGSYPVDCC
jgi:hypothetical protein